MTIQQIKEYFIDKEHIPCPLTEKLVKSGYQQESGGYIDRARKEGLFVDYTQYSPTQYWHLMTYCDSREGNKPFSKSIVCGELIFWMAEVSESVDYATLEQLANHIIESADHSKGYRPIYDRVKWNRIIQETCFEKIQSKVEGNIDYNKLRSIIARCEWTFAKTMPQCPHEYIVKEKCPLTTDEFEYFVNMQREHGVEERWGKYNFPYLYIDDYKYWTMGAPIEETIIINRAKV